jgi:GDP-L-fucose synthase
MRKIDKIYISGHLGLVGSAVHGLLKKNNFKNIIVKNKKKLDLLNQTEVYKFLKFTRPKYIIACAAKVGGVKSNLENNSDFLFENLQIQNNIIHGAYLANIKNLLFMGSSCIYPEKAKQPFKESSILEGKFFPGNEGYAIAKVAGLKLCEYYSNKFNLNYKTLMPCNIYGPNDHFNDSNSHFIPAIISKIYNAHIKGEKKVLLWGTGKPKRELLYVDDLAEAILFFLKIKTKEKIINIGSGKEYSIRQYAIKICKIIQSNVKIEFNKNKVLDGVKRKLNCNKIAKKYKWKPKFNLEYGLKKTIEDLKSKSIISLK